VTRFYDRSWFVLSGLCKWRASRHLVDLGVSVSIAAQGQFTERYSRAIEQVGQQGPDRSQIRIGGTYALERVARDSPRDQSTIIEVLVTFIRNNAKEVAEITTEGIYCRGDRPGERPGN
jgi:hypothetical protein